MNELLKNPSVSLIACFLNTDLSQDQHQSISDPPRQAFEPLANIFQSHSLKSITGSIKDGIAKMPSSGKPLAVNLNSYPIHDSWVVDFTLVASDQELTPQVFADFNPGGCLLADQFHADLGQTLFIYAEPQTHASNYPDIAHACVDAFLKPIDPKHKPILVSQGVVFGSPVFIYDNFESDPRQQCHIWVWLNTHPQTLSLFADNYFRLINLILYRTKVLFSFHQATLAYDTARTLNASLEADIHNFQQGLGQSEQLQIFKQKLQEIPQIAFNLSIQARDLNNHITTIDTNLVNFQQRLHQLQHDALPTDDLSFLQSFVDSSGKRYKEQIQVYLTYLAPSQTIYSQMIDTIRGLVEIQEADRDRSLERTIQVIGTGLGVAGVIGSSSPATLLDAKNQPQCLVTAIKALPAVIQTPFLFSFLLSIAGAFLAGLLVWLITRPKHRSRRLPFFTHKRRQF